MIEKKIMLQRRIKLTRQSKHWIDLNKMSQNNTRPRMKLNLENKSNKAKQFQTVQKKTVDTTPKWRRQEVSITSGYRENQSIRCR